MILKLRETAKHLKKFMVGDGRKTFLWLDSWHLDGVLFYLYGYRVIYDTRSKTDAMLFSVIRGGDWHWLPARSQNLVAIQSKLPDVKMGSHDTPLWLPSKSNRYSSKDTWEAIRVKQTRVEWDKLIWFSMTISKHDFVLWLVVKDCSSTGDRSLK